MTESDRDSEIIKTERERERAREREIRKEKREKKYVMQRDNTQYEGKRERKMFWKLRYSVRDPNNSILLAIQITVFC